jgi:threonyl-tRNA synthetase
MVQLGQIKELAAYIKRIEEAEKRDHRKIGKALDLFHMQEEAPGMVFWHPMVGRFTKCLNNTCVKFSKIMATKRLKHHKS